MQFCGVYNCGGDDDCDVEEEEEEGGKTVLYTNLHAYEHSYT